MKTTVDAMGMVMLILLGIIIILGMGIVIAAECRVINRLRVREELPPPPAFGPFPPLPPLNGRSQATHEREWYGHG
jgi:hypothetical protein